MVVISPSYQQEILQAAMVISVAPHGLIRNSDDGYSGGSIRSGVLVGWRGVLATATTAGMGIYN
jgi:hypothetical protein